MTTDIYFWVSYAGSCGHVFAPRSFSFWDPGSRSGPHADMSILETEEESKEV